MSSLKKPGFLLDFMLVTRLQKPGFWLMIDRDRFLFVPLVGMAGGLVVASGVVFFIWFDEVVGETFPFDGKMEGHFKGGPGKFQDSLKPLIR